MKWVVVEGRGGFVLLSGDLLLASAIADVGWITPF